MTDLPHMATCLALEAKAADPHSLLIEAVADLEKAVSSLNRSLLLMRAYRDAQQRMRQ